MWMILLFDGSVEAMLRPAYCLLLSLIRFLITNSGSGRIDFNIFIPFLDNYNKGN